MTSAFSLVENLKPVNILTNRVGNGAIASSYVSLKHAHKAWIFIDFTEGGANQVTFTPRKATAVAPSDATAITTAVPIWANLATGTSDRLVERAAATSYQTDVGVTTKQIVFEIDPALLGELAGTGPYDCIGVYCDAPNAADYLTVTCWIQPRYASQVSAQPTALTD